MLARLYFDNLDSLITGIFMAVSHATFLPEKRTGLGLGSLTLSLIHI